jgi:hypothetical protein
MPEKINEDGTTDEPDKIIHRGLISFETRSVV